jgi:hypothetical protein
MLHALGNAPRYSSTSIIRQLKSAGMTMRVRQPKTWVLDRIGSKENYEQQMTIHLYTLPNVHFIQV